MKRLMYLGAALLVVAFVSITVTGYMRPASNRQQSSPPSSVPLLRKSANLARRSSTSDSNASVDLTIQVNALQPKDVVNVRMGEQPQVMVAAGRVLSFDASRRSGFFRPGPSLPASSLEVTPETVTFNRPEPFDNIVFLDIQVPTGARVKVVSDGETVLNGALSQPLLLSNREWAEGMKGVPGVMLRSTFPQADKNDGPANPILDRSTGYYHVAYSKLQVLESEAVSGPGKGVVAVVLYIDESGKVEKAVPLRDNPPAGLEQSLLKWRFAPYLIDGRPVRVSAVLTIK